MASLITRILIHNLNITKVYHIIGFLVAPKYGLDVYAHVFLMCLGCSKIIAIITNSRRNLVLQQHFHSLDLLVLIVIFCWIHREVLSRSNALVTKFDLLSLGYYLLLELLDLGIAALKLLLLAVVDKYHLSHLLSFLVITLQVLRSKDLGHLLNLSETVL